MQIGVNYPQTEMEPDPGAIAAFTRGVEAMGFAYISTADHVVGPNPASRPGENLPHTVASQFHDPFTVFSFMAALSDTLGFVTAVMVLPQRQTTLVAKQAASLDVLCGGRFRLGIGTGWSADEYASLGATFTGRAARIEEQVEVLRALWTQDAVSYHGEHHSVPDMGINPRPVQQPVPIWFGGGTDRPMFGELASEVVMRRIARLGDGWIPQLSANDRGLELVATMRGFVAEHGRDRSTFGIEGRIDTTRASEGDWADRVEFWRVAGLSHLYVNTTRDGLAGVDEHLARLQEFRAAVPL